MAATRKVNKIQPARKPRLFACVQRHLAGEGIVCETKAHDSALAVKSFQRELGTTIQQRPSRSRRGYNCYLIEVSTNVPYFKELALGEVRHLHPLITPENYRSILQA